MVFNGNGYSDTWLGEAEKRGLMNLGNTVEALSHLNDAAHVEIDGVLVLQQLFDVIHREPPKIVRDLGQLIVPHLDEHIEVGLQVEPAPVFGLIRRIDDAAGLGGFKILGEQRLPTSRNIQPTAL